MNGFNFVEQKAVCGKTNFTQLIIHTAVLVTSLHHVWEHKCVPSRPKHQKQTLSESLILDIFSMMNFTSPAGSAHHGACLEAIWQLWEVWTGHRGQPPHREPHLANYQEIHGERRLHGGGRTRGVTREMQCFLLPTFEMCFFVCVLYHYYYHLGLSISTAALCSAHHSGCVCLHHIEHKNEHALWKCKTLQKPPHHWGHLPVCLCSSVFM